MLSGTYKHLSLLLFNPNLLIVFIKEQLFTYAALENKCVRPPRLGALGENMPLAIDFKCKIAALNKTNRELTVSNSANSPLVIYSQ